MSKQTFFGFAGALCDREVWVDFGPDGMAKLILATRQQASDLYCTYLKVTVEEVPEAVVARERERGTKPRLGERE